MGLTRVGERVSSWRVAMLFLVFAEPPLGRQADRWPDLSMQNAPPLGVPVLRAGVVPFPVGGGVVVEVVLEQTSFSPSAPLAGVWRRRVEIETLSQRLSRSS